ncbi:low-complexity protein [Pleurocapsa sp. CCALA 161]|nr:low-complexity protein [Pleurocapsa sp. CCALA 161]
MQNLEQHYKVLGLEPGASLEEVNQAYKDLVFIWHPDRVPQDNERLVKKSVAKIQQINEARDSLRSYHRKHKPAPAKQSASTAYSSSSTQSNRQAYRADNTRSNSSYSDRYTYQAPYSETENRQQTYSRPHYEQTQTRHWNYREYYSASNNPEQSSSKDGYQDFRETTKNPTSRSAQSTPQRPYYKDLRGADLSRSNFKERDFSGRDLSQANLSYADLSDTFLHKIILEEANLQGANLKGANLLQANLRNADLRDANLIGADLSGSDLSGANLSGAKVGFNNKIMVKITAVKLTGATLPDGSIHP